MRGYFVVAYRLPNLKTGTLGKRKGATVSCNPLTLLRFLVGRTGFEPVTNGLKVRGSYDSLMFMEFVCY